MKDCRTIKLFDEQGSVIGWLNMPMSARIADIGAHLSALGAARLELVSPRQRPEAWPTGLQMARPGC